MEIVNVNGDLPFLKGLAPLANLNIGLSLMADMVESILGSETLLHWTAD